MARIFCPSGFRQRLIEPDIIHPGDRLEEHQLRSLLQYQYINGRRCPFRLRFGPGPHAWLLHNELYNEVEWRHQNYVVRISIFEYVWIERPDEIDRCKEYIYNDLLFAHEEFQQALNPFFAIQLRQGVHRLISKLREIGPWDERTNLLVDRTVVEMHRCLERISYQQVYNPYQFL